MAEIKSRKQNNKTSGKARAKKLAKREAAEVRKKVRAKRTVEQQIAMLDEKFGVGKGAVKERARLLNLVQKKEEKVEDKKTEGSK